MTLNILNFEIDNLKFYDEHDDILESLGNIKPFNNTKQNKKSDLNLVIEMNNLENSFDDFSHSPIEKLPYCQLEYNGETLKFSNQEVFEIFITNNVNYIEPYYIFNIQKKTHVVVVKMRNIESICEYLIKFHHKQN